MRFLIQRVKHASVKIDERTAGEIEEGLLVFAGICQTDTTEIADKMIKKLVGLRIFEEFPNIQQGEFGANMQITLINDGPFTIVLDSDEICSQGGGQS